MALPAGFGIEQGTEPFLGTEHRIEHGAPAVELRALGGGQAGERFTRFDRAAAGPADEGPDEGERVGGPHGVGSRPVDMWPMRSIV